MMAFNLFSEPFTNALGWALVHSLWQMTILAVAAALALQLTPNQPSPVRYGIGIGTLLLQFLAFMGTLWICYEPLGAVMLIGGDQQTPVTQIDIVMSLPNTSDWSGPVSFWLNRHLSLLVTVWFCGAFLLLIRLFGGWLFVQRLTRRGSQPAPEAWQAYLDQLADQLGITTAVRLVESAEISVPMTIGWLKPIVLIPVGLLAGLSPRQVEAVLAHELAHIRRYDYLVNVVQSAVEIVLFFHPAVWWLSARIREEREHCCDDVAIQLCGERASLAQALVHIEKQRQATLAAPALAMAFGARKQSFMQRVKRVIGSHNPQSASKPNAAGLAGCLILLAGIVTGQHLYQPSAISRRDGDSVTINTWKSDTAIQPSAPEEEPVISLAATDTIDPVNKIRLKKELDQHVQEIERLEQKIEKLQLPMSELDKQLDLQKQKIQLSDKQMQEIQQALERNVQKSVELDMKRLQQNGKLSQADAQLLAKVQQDVVQAHQRVSQLNAGKIAEIQEKLKALNEGSIRILSDSIAKLVETASLRTIKILKLREKLGEVDSIPDMLPPVPPVPVFEPIPGPAIAPEPRPREGKPAKGKGLYWYNSKRYERPEDMPAAPVPPAPPAAVDPVLPVPPAVLPAVPDAPNPPKAPKAGKKGKYKKTN